MQKWKYIEKPDIKYRPDVRWWLAEGLHTDLTLKKEIADLHETGFGAVEFLAMDEPGADSSIYGWGSEEWIHDTNTLVEEAVSKGMGVSLTSGTNWANANLITIKPDDKAASKELDFAVEELTAGAIRSGEILKPEIIMPEVYEQQLEAAVAIRKVGEKDGKTVLDEDSSIVLTQYIQDGQLTWNVPSDGDYLLFFFWMHGTGQTAEPSVSTSYTINYLDRYGIEAFKEYWDSTVLTDELRDAFRKSGRGMMYMDSLELGTFGKAGQLWGYHFREEFQNRRGYDLTPYMPFILKEPGMMQIAYNYYYLSEDELFTRRLLNDVYQTMTDLYMENMLRPMQEWLHGHNMELRAEISYGLPFEISLPGKYVDGIETESLEFISQIDFYRNLAGPAHIYKRTFSSETGATLLNYMMGLDFYTQIIFTQFAAGVSRTVLHGYASICGSEETTQWPGHEGMWPNFSERFGSRQPAYKDYKEWTAMLSRFQMLLRNGKSRSDLGILRLDYEFNNMMVFTGDERDLYENRWMRGNEGIYWKDMELQNAGYSWDYFAPQILEEDFIDFRDGELVSEGPGYRALIVYQEGMPIRTAEKLLSLAEKGLPVLFVNGATETLRPNGIEKTHEKAASLSPFLDKQDENLRAVISRMKQLPNVREIDDQADTLRVLQEMGVYPRLGFTESNKNILTHVQEYEGKKYYYLYNMQYTQKNDFSFDVKIEDQGKLYRIDCWNAGIDEVCCYEEKEDGTVFHVTLAPGEARIYMLDSAERPAVHVISADVPVVREDGHLFAVAEKSGDYRIAFSDGTEKSVHATVPEKISLPKWDLVVEDWNEGPRHEIIEDRGLGIISKEVYFDTRKDLLSAGLTELKPWKDIPEIGDKVSGVGIYTTSFFLPEDWALENGAILKVGSVNKHTISVYVNGEKAPVVDFDALQTDISALVRGGENTIRVEVTSSLNNRLIARGYYERGGKDSAALAENSNNAYSSAEMNETTSEADVTELFDIHAAVQDYGMTGEVHVIPYVKIEI